MLSYDSATLVSGNDKWQFLLCSGCKFCGWRPSQREHPPLLVFSYFESGPFMCFNNITNWCHILNYTPYTRCLSGRDAQDGRFMRAVDLCLSPPLSEGKQRSYHLFWWPLADKNRVAAAILTVQSKARVGAAAAAEWAVAGLPSPCFHINFGVLRPKKCDGSVMACHRFWQKRRPNRQDNSGLLSMFSTCKVWSCQVDYWFYFWLVTSSTLTFYYSLIMVCYLHCHPPTKLAFIRSHHLM